MVHTKNSFAVLYASEETKVKCSDVISTLPHNILSHVISLLPLKSAVNTNFLSTQWKGLWNTTTGIEKHGTTIGELGNAILGLIANFDPIRTTWSALQFHNDIFPKLFVITATIVQNNKLHIDFSRAKKESQCIFSWTLWFHHRMSLTYKSSHSFVKTLHLKSVTCLTYHMASSLASLSHCLESLEISKCNGLGSLTLKCYGNLLNLAILDCEQLTTLVVEAKNLTSFRLRGPLPSVRVDSLCLRDVMLDCREGLGYNKCSSNQCRRKDIDRLLLVINDVKTLTLCKWTFEALIYSRLISELKPIRLRRLKKLWWIDDSSNCIEALMCFLRVCPFVDQLFVTIDPKSYCNAHASTKKCTFANQFDSDERLYHLEVVVLEGFGSRKDEIMVAKEFGKVVTKELIVLSRSEDNCLTRIIKVPSNGSKMKGKRNKNRSQEWCYKYIEEVELFPKHPHMCP